MENLRKHDIFNESKTLLLEVFLQIINVLQFKYLSDTMHKNSLLQIVKSSERSFKVEEKL